MDFEAQNFFKELTEYLKQGNYGLRECQRRLEILNRNLIEEQIDSDFLDTYLIHIFNTSNGLPKFIEESARIKIFRKASCKATEILFTLVNNFPTRLSDTNVLEIYKLATIVTKSSIDAIIKSKIFDLILLCFEKINFSESNNVCKELFITLQNVLQQNHGDTVKQKEMMVLGAYTKTYRYLIEDSAKKKLQSIFLRNFQIAVAKRPYPQTVLYGFFTGFLHFCESFPLHYNEDKSTIVLLYGWIKKLAIILKKDKIKMANRAALTFFTKNIHLFENGLLEDYLYWHEKLLYWLDCGTEERKTGIYAAKALYEKIGETLREKSDKGNRIIQYFNTWSKTTLENKHISTAEKHLAIYCLKQMSEASYKNLDENEFTNLFLSIMQIFEQTYILDSNPQTEDWEYLPDYIQTVSNFIRFKTFTTSEFFCLQRAAINMIKSFHQLPYLHHVVVVDSIIVTLVNLKTTGYFDIFLENIIYQGVVWSCSHQHMSNDAFADEVLEKIVTVKNYFPLWTGILKLSSNIKYEFEVRQYIVERVVNELIKTMMILINKLNMSVKLKEENMAITDIQNAYQVEKDDDYAIFLNVVDFYQEVFNHIRPRLLKKCIFKIVLHLISKCLQFPLTSGFYKLLSFSLKVVNDLKLFENEDDFNQDLNNCRESLELFLSVLLNKMKDYKDELAIACLHVLLETPVIIIKNMLPACVTPFINIFKVGKSYLPLADMGIHTLQYWQDNIEPELLDPVLIKIIPSLDTFLRSKSLGGHLMGSTDKRRKTAQALKKRKVILELEPELLKIQRKILSFIGRQSLKNCQAFVFCDDVIVPNSICGQNPYLKITLPYEDLQLEIYLDTFLPRIIDLALYCSDRKTRITACELVQAVIMIFLGKAKPMTIKSGLTELNDMLKFLAMPLLQLSCDVDQVVRQIFEPLFLQLIHWYTSPTQLRGAHTGIIIDTIMEGITDPTNSSLRDFSGKCINEFLKWTIKQSSEESLAADPVNIKVLVKKMRYFSSHPDPVKKLGAALIFNNIYRELREEETLISIFWVEILHIFVNSLSSIEYSSEFDQNVTIEQTQNALKHVQRVFVERANIFRKIDSRRRTPNDLNDGTLKNVSIWLLNQSGNKSKYCRETCMELFIKITPLSIQNSTNLTTFIKQNFNGSLLNMYDKMLFDFPRNKANENYTILFKWLNIFLCALDGYNFVLQNNLEEIVFNANVLCNQIEYFLLNLQDIQLAIALNLIEEKGWRYTLSDKDLFNNLKLSCIFSILKLHKTIINEQVLVKTAKRLWNRDFWKLICNSIFSPELLAINEIVKPKFLDILKVLISAIPNKLPKVQVTSFVDYLKSYINDRQFSTADIKVNVGLKQRNTTSGLLYLNNIYISEEFKEYLETLQEGLVDNMVNNFYKDQKDNIIFASDLPETTFRYFSTVLKFSLTNKNEFVCLIEHLHSSYLTHSMDFTKELRFGVYILKKFPDAVLPIIINNFEEFLGLSMAKQEIKLTVEYLNLILNDVMKNKKYAAQHKTVYNSIMQVWPTLVEFFNASKGSVDISLEFAKYLIQLNNQCSVDIHHWLMDTLIRGNVETQLDILNLLILTTDEEISLASSDLPNILFIAADRLMPESTDLSTNSNTLGKILSLLPAVKSSVVFKFMMDQYLKSSSNVDITHLFSKYITDHDEVLQQKSLTIVFDMCFNEDIIFDNRYKVAREVMPILLQNSSLAVFEHLFVENINKVVLDLKINENYENNIINFILVELLFLRLPIGSQERQNCPISAAANEPNLLAVLVKCALESFKVVHTNNTIRKYKCHAYNALSSMVSNSRKLSKFYEKLFIRNNGDKDILWSSIVDTTVQHKFQLFFDTLPKQRKVLVNIRDELREKRSLESNQVGSMQYIGSQRLFNSSLSEDVTNFDFTNSMIRTQRIHKEVVQETKTWQSEVFLDATVINEHECMATICGLIQHIFDSGVEELPKEDDDIKCPSWMSGIRNTLLNPNTHNNIKIFLVKVIDNMFHIFTHYSKWFIEPLLKFVVEKCAGDSINYFITDVLVILSKWAALCTNLSNTERQLTSELLQFLVAQLDVERRDIFKYNIDIIKLIVESWKSYIEVPIQQISTLLKNKDKCELGIHVSSVFLVNRLAPWQEGDAEVFLELVLKRLHSTSKSLVRPAAETIGLALHFLKDEQCTEIVDRFLQKVSQDNYNYCLEGVALHYPLIVNNYHMSKLISTLNQQFEAIKLSHLRIICKRIEASCDILEDITDFEIVEWDSLLEDSSLEIQIVTLQIIRLSLKTFSKLKNFPNILQSLIRNVSHTNDLFRNCLYDVAIEMYKQNIGDVQIAVEILVLGLIDFTKDNQEKIVKFWTENSNLPGTVVKRFPYLLFELYRPKIEDRYLGFLVYFLLSLLFSNENYDSELFEHPLEDCDFEDYKLQTNWRLQHPSVVPMFAETLQSLNADEFHEGPLTFHLRRTQTVTNFIPTQSFQEQQLKQFTSMESSLAVNLANTSHTFKDPNTLNLSQKYHVGKRFLKDKSKISKEFAHYEVRKQVQKVQKRIDSAKEREKKVTIYRKYRKGDFPDIQIKRSSVLKPLQMLSLQDSEVSKLLFLEFFKGLASKVDNNADFLKTVKDGIKSIFNTSTSFNTHLISAMLDILLENKDKIRFDPQLVSYVCQESNLISVGTLLFEEYVMLCDDQPSGSKRGTGAQESQEMAYWIKLAELYKQLEEWDVVQAIFLEKMNCKEIAQSAIRYESEAMWRNAQELYQELIQTDMSSERKDFYYESYFNCFAHLGEWKELPKAISSVVGEENMWANLWDGSWCQQKLLPWYITAHVRNGLFTESWSDEFVKYINIGLSEDTKREYLKGNFSEELCMMALAQSDIPLATIYLKSYIKYFLENWQILNPMFQSLRYQKILKLHTFMEIDEFIDMYKHLDEPEPVVKNLINRWQNTSKEVFPSILLNETRILYRSEYNRLLTEKLKTEADTRCLKELKITKIRMDLDFINYSAENNNYYMARKYYKLHEKLGANPKFQVAFGNIAVAKSKILSSVEEEVKACVDAVTIFSRIPESTQDQMMNLTVKMKLFGILLRLSNLFTKKPDLLTTHQDNLNEKLKTTISNPQNLEKYATNILKSCTGKFDQDMEVDGDQSKENKYFEIAKAYVALAHAVRNQEDQQSDFITYVLRAMKMNSSEARQLFPCILLIDGLGIQFKEVFIRESEQIPLWMFLGWLPQLLANVDSSKIFAISGIVKQIAETYPQAIMYPYRLSKESYNFDIVEISAELKSLTDRLDELLLKDEMINKFLKALCYVSVPESMLRYYIAKMRNSQNLEKISSIQNTLMNDIFEGTCDSRNVESMRGNMFKKIGMFRKDFQKMPIVIKKVTENLKKIDALLCESLNKIKSSTLLKDYCPWLANFSANKQNIELEIPGQYDGQKLPLPQHHIKISGFHPEVTVMESLRKPIKITILGMDTKEYPFLLKFGEDIRQDQRIEQLYSLMNDIFKSDTVCTNKGLDILTYQVIPLTSNLGIIQWINDTIPLNDFIRKSIKDLKVKQDYEKTKENYYRWLPKIPNVALSEIYGTAATKYDRNKTITFYRGLVNKIPLDILKTAYWNLSTSTENFIALRNNFIKTYAVLCISQWILGIGDRHLNNSLICLKNGKVLGIDFGHAFGTATQIIPVPELVPIRLTPHIINVMEPLKERGQFKACMIHVLRALRNNSNSLLATMNVFVQEPSLDWLEHAARFETLVRSELKNWYPKNKVNQASRKLQGTSSVQIMVEDLEASNLQKFIKANVKLVKGSQEFDSRAKFDGNSNLSVEEQVECLIDHASDFNLLGRMFHGWMSWV